MIWRNFNIKLSLFFFALCLRYNVFGHSVQVAYCANCNGDLRIWVEHWHSNEDINSTTMTIDVTVSGVTTTYTGSPNSGVLGVPFASLAGCSSPLTIFGSCPGEADTYNDWVAYDFVGMPVGVPIIITIISGNSAFTEDGCGMYPASTGTIIIQPPPTFSNVTTCSGTGEMVGPFSFPQGSTWTNDNTSIGLAASGTGDISAFLPTVSPSTQVANITLSNSCGNSTFSITVNPSPVPNFTAPGIAGGSGIACPGQPITFSDISTPASGSSITAWQWDFGDGSPLETTQNPTHTFPLGSSTYIVTLTSTDANGCAPDTSLTINLNGPAAAFTTANVCDGNSALFTDGSTPTGDIVSWKWDFNNDGIIDNTTQNPSFIFPGPGTYQTELLIETSGGCKDSVVQTIVVNPNPVAGFTHNNVCYGDTMYFTNTSTINNPGSIASYLWSFGDFGPTSSLKDPSHYYTPETYAVTLVVTSTDGCTSASTIPVSTFDAPTGAFTFNNTCLSDSTSFANSSTPPTMGSISSWSWDFGDGTPLNTTAWSPSHQYTNPGNYIVTLTAYSSNLSCPDTVKDTITIFPIPVASFNFIEACVNQPINFIDASYVSGGSITNWIWDFGAGGAVDSSQNPVAVYSFLGSYPVTLVVTSNNACSDTLVDSVIVHPVPVPLFTTSNVCLGNLTPFTDLSLIPSNLSNDVIQSWAWNFGDGSPVYNNQNTTHQYSSTGFFSVKLVVVSTFGCADSLIKTTVVSPNPTVKFISVDTLGCEPLCTTFQNSSFITSGIINSYLWDFGDGGATDTIQNPIHCYNNNLSGLTDYFDVTLTVTSDSGCISTLTKDDHITVYPLPEPNFTIEPETATIINPVVSITDSTSGAIFWSWDFGDGSTAFDTSFVSDSLEHTYADTGTYTITLIATSQYGCIDTAYQTATVSQDFAFYIPSGFSPNNDGKNEVFRPVGIFVGKFEMKIYDRWGNFVFYSDDFNKGWDGTVNNGAETILQDIYVYVIKATDIKKKKHYYRGTITVVR